MRKLKNYTPHKVLTYRPDDGPSLTLPQSGNVRLIEEFVSGGTLPNGLPLTLLRYGKADGLPEPSDGIVYVVSQLVVNAYPQRDDLVFPAGLVRNDNGDIIGFRLLARPADSGNAINAQSTKRG